MKLWEFKKLTKLPNFFLFYGDEFFLDIYEKEVYNIVRNCNVSKFYYDEYQFEIIKNHLSQNSLFGDRNAVIIKTDKYPQNIDKLIKIVGDNYLYLFFKGESKKVKTKAFGKNFVRFFKPDLKDLIITSNEFMKKNNITNINLEHLKYLISKTDYRFLFQELLKLSLVTNLNNKKIDKLVFNYNETSFDDVFDTLFSNGNYLEKLEYLLFQGNDEIAILMSFTRYIKILYMFNLHIKNIGYENVSKEVLGYQLPKNVEELRKKIAFNIKEEKFLLFFEILLEAELDMKTSKDKNALLFKVFIEINNNKQ